MLFVHGEGRLGHDSSGAVELDKHSILSHVRVQLHRGGIITRVDPGRGAHSAHASNLARFLTRSGHVLGNRFAHSINIIDQVTTFHVLLNHAKLAQT